MPRKKTTPEGPPVTAADAGRRGGATTARRYGSEHYRKIGKRGGEKTAAAYPGHLKEIAQKGGERTRDLIEKGRQTERKAKAKPA